MRYLFCYLTLLQFSLDCFSTYTPCQYARNCAHIVRGSSLNALPLVQELLAPNPILE